jgi:hypothetical protein
MKKIVVAVFLLLVGCSYSPTYRMVKDSYNTYAPTYAPYSAPVYSPVQATYTTMQPKKVKKVKKTKRTIYPNYQEGVTP